MKDDDERLLQHYREQAVLHGSAPSSTMADQVTREKELELIRAFVRWRATSEGVLRVLDLGCGNGYALATLAELEPGHRYHGMDFSPELLEIAAGRGIPGLDLRRGDARSLPYDDGTFSAVYTERCLINILDRQGQSAALSEIARVLQPGGHYLMIECFTDGHENYNRARTECGLDEIPVPHHNLFFDKPTFLADVREMFTLVAPAEAGDGVPVPNFLSSHYFAARVLHPLVTRGEQVHNTEFVRFFSHLPPMGNYAPVQAYVLRTSDDSA